MKKVLKQIFSQIYFRVSFLFSITLYYLLNGMFLLKMDEFHFLKTIIRIWKIYYGYTINSFKALSSYVCQRSGLGERPPIQNSKRQRQISFEPALVFAWKVCCVRKHQYHPRYSNSGRQWQQLLYYLWMLLRGNPDHNADAKYSSVSVRPAGLYSNWNAWHERILKFWLILARLHLTSFRLNKIAQVFLSDTRQMWLLFCLQDKNRVCQIEGFRVVTLLIFTNYLNSRT